MGVVFTSQVAITVLAELVALALWYEPPPKGRRDLVPHHLCENASVRDRGPQVVVMAEATDDPSHHRHNPLVSIRVDRVPWARGGFNWDHLRSEVAEPARPTRPVETSGD